MLHNGPDFSLTRMKSPFAPQPAPLPKATDRWIARLNVPVEFGTGCLDRIPAYLQGARHAMIATGQKAMKAAGVTERLCGILLAADVKTTVYSGLSAEQNHQEITEAADLARSAGVDIVIGCGGGSALDGAKAIAVAASHPHPVMDYILNGPRVITSATLPILAVSSTSGTGSHVGRVSVLSDREKHIKRALISDYIYPRAAFCDPLVLQTMTPDITATTGFDAFAQALEGFLSSSENPLGNLCAEQAMAIIFPTLPRVLKQGDDMDLRIAMAWGDTLAGISLASNAVITPHIFSMVLGARYGITHGKAIASVTVACLRHSRAAAVPKFAHIAKLLGAPLTGTEEARADWTIQAIDDWLDRIGLKCGLRHYGVRESDFDSIAHEMRGAFSLRLDCDPIPPDVPNLVRILHNAYD